ncbi:hypothetical protein B0H13DRAFT_1889309 [Mycena leptocephala]|nr:hypothetical protein B0H13DRAFT_1889309 [Mycena leptocephala]
MPRIIADLVSIGHDSIPFVELNGYDGSGEDSVARVMALLMRRILACKINWDYLVQQLLGPGAVFGPNHEFFSPDQLKAQFPAKDPNASESTRRAYLKEKRVDSWVAGVLTPPGWITDLHVDFAGYAQAVVHCAGENTLVVDPAYTEAKSKDVFRRVKGEQATWEKAIRLEGKGVMKAWLRDTKACMGIDKYIFTATAEAFRWNVPSYATHYHCRNSCCSASQLQKKIPAYEKYVTGYFFPTGGTQPLAVQLPFLCSRDKDLTIDHLDYTPWFSIGVAGPSLHAVDMSITEAELRRDYMMVFVDQTYPTNTLPGAVLSLKLTSQTGHYPHNLCARRVQGKYAGTAAQSQRGNGNIYYTVDEYDASFARDCVMGVGRDSEHDPSTAVVFSQVQRTILRTRGQHFTHAWVPEVDVTESPASSPYDGIAAFHSTVAMNASTGSCIWIAYSDCSMHRASVNTPHFAWGFIQWVFTIVLATFKP